MEYETLGEASLLNGNVPLTSTYTDSDVARVAADEVSYLNRLLRGEISASETYAQALEKFPEIDRARAVLQAIKTEHDQAIYFLRDRINALAGEPEESSGIWGTFAQIIEGTAKIFGKKSALIALEEGEDHGISEYLDVIDALQPATYLSKFLALTRQHKKMLEDLIVSVEE